MRLLPLLAAPALFVAPALTASSAVPPTAVGAGEGIVSGYTISAVSYTLDDEVVDAVSFALSPAGAATVKARVAPGKPWTDCSVSGSVASCPVGTPVAAADVLQVVAAG